MTDFSPREIVSELDRFIVGQGDAKRAVAIALRNRWRRLKLDDKLREEVLPKNILMIGPTGVGKTEISRRLARLAGAPFLKVEATKFTEVGYVGRDVEQIVRDLVEISIALTRERKRKDVLTKAEQLAEERVLDALVGPGASPATRESFRKKLRAGEINDKEIEVEVQQSSSGMPMFEIPGMPGAQMGAISIGDIFGKLGGNRSKTRRITVEESHDLLIAEESDKLLDNDSLVQESIRVVEQNGIVFLDEIDKICAREGRMTGDVSREGVQRDLLPLIEGTTVNTKHGPVKTDHILFIASGAFHISKPSDLLPELQGRLPIRVELAALTRDDMRRILTEPEASLIKQYIALLATEGVTLEFSEDAIDAIADIAVAVNSSVENIGARRLQTVMERVLDEVSFAAPDRGGETVKIDAAYVDKHIGDLAKNADLTPLYSLIERVGSVTASASEPGNDLAQSLFEIALGPHVFLWRLNNLARRPFARRFAAFRFVLLLDLLFRLFRHDTFSLIAHPPQAHVQRALAAVFDTGILETDHKRAKLGQRQPVRHLALEHAALAGALAAHTFAGNHQHQPRLARAGLAQETQQGRMRFALRQPMQIELPSIVILAARDARRMRRPSGASWRASAAAGVTSAGLAGAALREPGFARGRRGFSAIAGSASMSGSRAPSRRGAIERVTVDHSTRSSCDRPRRFLPSRLLMAFALGCRPLRARH